jgi:hypothetical protein
MTFDPDLKGPDTSIPLPGGKGELAPKGEGPIVADKDGNGYRVLERTKDNKYKVADPSGRISEIDPKETTNPHLMEKLPKWVKQTHKNAEAAIENINELTEYRNPINERERVIGNTAVEIYPTHDGRLHIGSLRSFVPKQGSGTETMKKLIEIADKHGIELELDPVPLATPVKIPKMKLTKWYRSFGFKFKDGLMVRKVGATGPATKTVAKAAPKKAITDDAWVQRADAIYQQYQATWEKNWTEESVHDLTDTFKRMTEGMSKEQLEKLKIPDGHEDDIYFNSLIDEAIKKAES